MKRKPIKSLRSNYKSVTPPSKSERAKRFKGFFDISTPEKAANSLKQAIGVLNSKEMSKLKTDAKHRHILDKNPKKEGPKVLRKDEPAKKKFYNYSDDNKMKNSIYNNKRNLLSLPTSIDLSVFYKKSGINERTNMSLFDRVVSEAADKDQEKMGRYEQLKAKAMKDKMAKKKEVDDSEDEDEMEEAKFVAAGADDKSDEGGEEKESESSDAMKKRMAELRAMRGKKKSKSDDDKEDDEDEDEDEDEMEEAVGSESSKKQSSGNSDDFFAWSQKRKPKAVKVKPKGSDWDYNPVPVNPDSNHGQIDLDKKKKEVVKVSESLEKLKKDIFG